MNSNQTVAKLASEAEERAAVVAEANSWLRTPYHDKAHVKGQGVDCGWLMICAFANLGMIPDDFDPGYYAAQWALNQTEELFIEFVEKFSGRVEAPSPGDIVLFKVGHTYSHGAIVVDWPLIIHASNADRMVTLADARKCHRLLTNKDGTMRPHLFYSYWSRPG